MSQPIKFTLTNESLTVIHEGSSHTIQRGAPNWLSLRDALLNERWEQVPGFLTIRKSIESWAKGKFTVQGEVISYEGKALPRDLTSRIIAMVAKGDDPQSLFNFWERLQKNPSFRSVNQLWSFLQNRNIPLTPEGNFLAYKSVRFDYKDHHSNTFDNSPGRINKMTRNMISDDPANECDPGFHVGAIDYAKNVMGAGRIVICEVDPENVVSVPRDHNAQKMRVCEYKVIGNYGSDLPSTTFVEDATEPDHGSCPIEDESEDGDDEDVKEVEEDEDESGEGEAVDDDGNSEEGDEDEGIVVDEDDGTSEEGKAIDGREDGDGYSEEEGATTPAEVKSDEGPKKTETLEAVDKIAQVVEIIKTPKGPATSQKVAKRKPKKGFAKLDKLDFAGLMGVSIDELRKYAGHGLEIVGASKIPGGKTALVTAILGVRQ